MHRHSLTAGGLVALLLLTACSGTNSRDRTDVPNLATVYRILTITAVTNTCDPAVLDFCPGDPSLDPDPCETVVVLDQSNRDINRIDLFIVFDNEAVDDMGVGRLLSPFGATVGEMQADGAFYMQTEVGDVQFNAVYKPNTDPRELLAADRCATWSITNGVILADGSMSGDVEITMRTIDFAAFDALSDCCQDAIICANDTLELLADADAATPGIQIDCATDPVTQETCVLPAVTTCTIKFRFTAAVETP